MVTKFFWLSFFYWAIWAVLLVANIKITTVHWRRITLILIWVSFACAVYSTTRLSIMVWA